MRLTTAYSFLTVHPKHFQDPLFAGVSVLQFIFILFIYCSYIPDVKPHGVIVTGKLYFSIKYIVLGILEFQN